LSISAISTALRRGFKVVCTLHDYSIACPTAGFFDRRTTRICPLKGLSRQCLVHPCTRSLAGKGHAVVRQLVQVRAGVPHIIKHFITLSDLSELILLPYLGLGASIYRVSNPIDVSRSQPVDVAGNEIYSMIARLDLEKGVLLFADAAKRGGLQSIFVGDGQC